MESRSWNGTGFTGLLIIVHFILRTEIRLLLSQTSNQI